MKRILLFIVVLSVTCLACGCKSKNNVPNIIQELASILNEDEGKGEGVRVAVIDSGTTAENEHSGYALNFSEEDNGIDGINHGVPIMNIISHEKFGLSPKVTIYSLKVINKYGNASTESIYQALEWCLNNSIDLINMSLSFGIHSENIECLVSELVNKGVIIVASINNDNRTIDYPSMYDGVICVGKTNSLDLYEKDRCVIFQCDQTITIEALNGEEKDFVGNSYLTPVVTGIIACLIDKNNMEGSVSNAELITAVKAILNRSNVSVG